MHSLKTKNKAQRLRRDGKTYSEIQKIIGISLPKPTLSYWCKDIILPEEHKKRIIELNTGNLARGRAIRILQRREKRKENFLFLQRDFKMTITTLDCYQKKLLLAMLYLGEGGKFIGRAGVMLGNSDPKIIKIFLRLMRSTYVIDEAKFRCTLQCRADQDIVKLESFWSRVANIPLSKFYKAQIDKRTIGKATKKKDYSGVLRVDYFSADIFHELMNLSEILSEGL